MEDLFQWQEFPTEKLELSELRIGSHLPLATNTPEVEGVGSWWWISVESDVMWSVAPESGYQTTLAALLTFWPYRGWNHDFLSITIGNLLSLWRLKQEIAECPRFRQIWQMTTALPLIAFAIGIIGVEALNRSLCACSRSWNVANDMYSVRANWAMTNVS